MPYTKPNNTPLCIHSKPNHPPVMIRNLQESIDKRLSDLSSDEDVLNRAVPAYQKALKHSGFNHQLKFKPSTPANVPDITQNRKRQGNSTWYNPPYSKNVVTNIGRTSLNILDEEFQKNHVLYKIMYIPCPVCFCAFEARSAFVNRHDML